jgi:hypothetical protein
MPKANASRRFPLTLFPILVIAAVFIAVDSPRNFRDTISAQTRRAAQSPDPFEIRLASRRFTSEEARPEWSKLFARSKSEKLHAIVQFREIPSPQTTTALASAGISLGQPLSGHSYLATIKRGVKTSAAALNQLRWAGAFSSEDKFSPAIQHLEPSAYALRNAGRVELVVTIFVDADFAAATKKAQALGATILGEARLLSRFAVSLPLNRERELASENGIQYLEPLPAPGKGESDRARTHVHADVGAIPAGRPTGQGVIAAIFDASHALTTHADFGTRVVQGDAPDNHDPEGHPMMTAGMIAGDGTISIGQGALMTRQWRGLAPAAAQVRSYSFLSSGTNSVTDYLNDVASSVQNSAVVLNNSWGTSGCNMFPYGSYEDRAPALDAVVTGSLGRPVTIVFSAGNERMGYVDSNGIFKPIALRKWLRRLPITRPSTTPRARKT